MIIALQTGSLPAVDQNFSLGMFCMDLLWRVQCCASQFHNNALLPSFSFPSVPEMSLYIPDARGLWQRLLISYLSDNNKTPLVNPPVGVPSDTDGHVYF